MFNIMDWVPVLTVVRHYHYVVITESNSEENAGSSILIVHGEYPF